MVEWMNSRVPEFLLFVPPGGLFLWQWLALVLVALIALVGGFALSVSSRWLLRKLVQRTQTEWDDRILKRLAGPMTGAWSLLVVYPILPWLELAKPASEFLFRWLGLGLFLVFFWFLLRAVELLQQSFTESTWSKEHPSSRPLVLLGSRSLKVVVLVVAGISVLAQLGYPVTSLVAGLGIGGLAFALAAQKTVENLFGAFSIGVDQPFREGDFVRLDDFVGTVEAVGLRSTKIRTLDRTVIAVPNSTISDAKVENYSVRDRIRLSCSLGLVYQTSAVQMSSILKRLEELLRSHPKIWPDTVNVRFSGFGASSLDIEVMAWFLTKEWGEFLLIRQELFLDFMKIVEKEGSSFAYPTMTVFTTKP